MVDVGVWRMREAMQPRRAWLYAWGWDFVDTHGVSLHLSAVLFAGNLPTPLALQQHRNAP